MIKYITNKLKLYLYLIFGNADSRSFILFLKKKWRLNEKHKHKINGLILVDFFHHYPFVYFWSYLTNIISKKKNYAVRYFYFPLYENLTSKSTVLNNTLRFIYKAFNVSEGLNEKNFKLDKKIEKKIKVNFSKINNKEQLVKFKYKGIKIGDLIYDSYLRAHFKITANLNDKNLYQIFKRALTNFYEIENYLKLNKVKLIIPSHIQYFQFAMLVRIACKNKINVIKLHSNDWGNNKFRLQKVNPVFPNEKACDHFDFKKIFKNLKNKKEKIVIGKKILKHRITGNYDKNLSYMTESQFKKKNKENDLFKFLKNKKIVVVYLHCFFDAPHKYRYMVFPDFYEQIKFLLKITKQKKEYTWIFKRHPNELPENDHVYNEIFKNQKNVIFIKDELNSYDLSRLDLKLAITDHGTIAHELAYLNIPVINTGDNPHINYNFNFHAKNKNDIIKFINKILNNKKKFKFNKKELFEFAYLYYVYYENLYNEKSYNLDKYLATKNREINSTSKVLDYYVKNDKFNSKKIISYINNFIKKNNI